MTTDEYPTPGTYRHYKGGEYSVTGVAANTTDDDKPYVMYQALYECEDLKDSYGLYPWFIRSLESFNADVEVDGETVRRFTQI